MQNINIVQYKISNTFFIVFLLSMAFFSLKAQNYTRNLPSSIILQNGESRSDILTSVCGNQYCAFGLMSNNAGSYDFSYSTHNGSSKLSLVANTPTNPYNHRHSVFYMRHLNVGENSTLSINDFHTFALSGGLTLNNNAALEIILQKGEKIPASEFAPSSKVHFSRNANFYLGNGSTLNISNTDFVIISSKGIINNNAQMILDSSTIRFQNTLHNKGTIELTGDVYNIGQSQTITNLGTSHFINYGNVKVNGNFYNGGTPRADSVQGSWWQNDAPSPGGGNLINYGGTIHITGNLINAQGVELGKTQNSSVQIYGGTIKVDGGINNGANNTLILGWYNGKMGQIDGNVTNRGIAKVDITGATLNTDHRIAGGWHTGRLNANRDVLLNGSKSEFLNARISHYQNSTTITLNKNTQAINAFMNTLPIQSKTILTALENSLYNPNTIGQQSIYAYGNKNYLTKLGNNINESAESMLLYASPLNIWAIVQNSIMPLKAQVMPPPRKSVFNIAPLSSIASRGSLKSPLNGVNISAQIPYKTHFLSAFAAYGNTNATHTLTHLQTHFDTNSFLVGLYDRISLPYIEVSLLAYYGASFNKAKRHLLLNNSAFQTRYSYHELGLSAQIAHLLRFEKLWIKPFIGINYAFGLQSAFKENLVSDTTSAMLTAPMWLSHLPQLSLGTQGQYYLKKQHFLFGGAQIQYALTNSSFSAHFGSSVLNFNPQNSLGLTLHFGGSMPIAKEFSLSAYTLYSRSHLAFQSYSGTINLSYYF